MNEQLTEYDLDFLLKTRYGDHKEIIKGMKKAINLYWKVRYLHVPRCRIKSAINIIRVLKNNEIVCDKCRG